MPTLNTLASFNGTDGEYASGSLTTDAAGDLFGINGGGTNNDGAVFEIAKTGNTYSAPTILASFNGTDGEYPLGNLTTDAAGDLFGTTEGQPYSIDGGTVFEITKTGNTYSAPTTLASFTDGQDPLGNLTIDAAGDFFGTTFDGDDRTSDGGTVFEIAKTGNTYSAPTILAFFDGSTYGEAPLGRLNTDAAGDLFGTTTEGGTNNDGAVFEIAKTGNTYSAPTILAFPNGASPASLTTDAAGDLFGTTNEWTVFEIAKTGNTYSAPTTLASTDGGSGNLTTDAVGDLFGTTTAGGTNNWAVFEIAKTGNTYSAPTILASFNGTDGQESLGNLITDAAGDLFGTTAEGGTDNDETVFEITASDAVTLHGSSSQYVIINDNGALYLQDSVAGRDGNQALPGINLIMFTDGVGVFDPTGTAEDVARLYGAALDRAPDLAGLEYWTAQVDGSNLPLSAVATAFTTSPEFMQDYASLSIPAFVNQLYENVLGRPADAAGAQYWDGLLASGASRATVVLGFAESQEYQAKALSTAGDKNNAEAYRLYQAALNRVPDAGGQTYWSSMLASGATPTQIAQGFINSAEFQQKYGSLSANEFVSTLYQNALHRVADPGGQQYWTSQLQSGASRSSVLVGFCDSLESRLNTASATHDGWVFIHA